jgi:hypothetical protein
MSDIFISYARPDQPLAQSLADDLKTRGFKVWWDTELLGSDDFYEVIYTALSNAKAAIVIWTKNSCHSRFVRDEARFALQKEKLVATKAPDCSFDDIPFGFQGQHTEDVTQRDKIILAVERLGAKSSTDSTLEDEAKAWEKANTSKDPDQLVQFVDRYPTSPNRRTALLLVRTLSAQGATSGKPEIADLRTGKVGAFFQGLTFRIPRFQLSAQGLWSSIGLSIGFVLLTILGLNAVRVGTAYWYGPSSLNIVFLAVYASMVVLIGLWQFHKWIGQRLFVAAFVTAAVNTFFTLAATMFLFFLFVPRDLYDGIKDSTEVFLALLGPPALLMVVYSIWKMWRAR